MPNPTKKQYEIYDYITQFISEHGYAPSFREIKRGLSYSSIGSVAYHVDKLIALSMIRKVDNSARSLEIVNGAQKDPDIDISAHEKWLVDLIDTQFRFVENNNVRKANDITELGNLVNTLRLLGLSGAHSSFQARLSKIKNTHS